MLVIIGLIIGGVLVGQDLVDAGTVRAQITQIEKYNQAVNTFYGKYDALPGDINSADATQYGLIARSGVRGLGDANGMLEGNNGSVIGAAVTSGELALFWADLTTTKLIEGNFTNPCCGSGLTSTVIYKYLPAARVGNGNFVYVYTGGSCCGGGWIADYKGNFFGISVLTSVTGGAWPISNPGLTVQQAYKIDTKIDDGFPQKGNVTAQYVNEALSFSFPQWAAGGGVAGASGTGATTGSPTTCYDNGGAAGLPQTYSITQNNGSGMNCALSFKFH